MDRTEAEKVARTEAIFREVNERIAETAQRLDAAETAFVCECSDPNCTHRVRLSLDEYEEVRNDAASFLILNGHADERVEAVTAANARHEIVEKRHPLVRPLVIALDPRGATS
jgi:hypothetical protein